MNTSEKIDEIVAALCKAKGKFDHMFRGKEVNAGKYTFYYCPLETIIASVDEPLRDNGIFFFQSDCVQNQNRTLKTRLIHTSGQWIESQVEVIYQNGTAQNYGAALTYARRYGLSEILGISPEDDDESRLEDNKSVVLNINQRPPKDSKDPRWQGPETKTKLREHAANFAQEMRDCQNEDDLKRVAESPEYKTFIKQASHDLPGSIIGETRFDEYEEGLRAIYKHRLLTLRQLAEFEPVK